MRRERLTGEDGLVERAGAVLLPVGGRVEVWLELSEAVRVQRPLHEPVETRRLAIASDEPERLVDRLSLSGAPESAGRRARDKGVDAALGLLVALDIAGLVREAAQPS